MYSSIITEICRDCQREQVCPHGDTCPCRPGVKHYCRKCNTNNSLHRSANCTGLKTDPTCLVCGAKGHNTCRIRHKSCSRHKNSNSRMSLVIPSKEICKNSSKSSSIANTSASISHSLKKYSIPQHTNHRIDLDVRQKTGKSVVILIPWCRDNHGSISVSFHADGVTRRHGRTEIITPGGTVESHQTIRQAVCVEAMEEQGLNIPDPERIIYFNSSSSKNGVSYIYLTYQVLDLRNFRRIPLNSRWEVHSNPNYIPNLGIRTTNIRNYSNSPIQLISLDEIVKHANKFNNSLLLNIRNFFNV